MPKAGSLFKVPLISESHLRRILAVPVMLKDLKALPVLHAIPSGNTNTMYLLTMCNDQEQEVDTFLPGEATASSKIWAGADGRRVLVIHLMGEKNIALDSYKACFKVCYRKNRSVTTKFGCFLDNEEKLRKYSYFMTY